MVPSTGVNLDPSALFAPEIFHPSFRDDSFESDWPAERRAFDVDTVREVDHLGRASPNLAPDLGPTSTYHEEMVKHLEEVGQLKIVFENFQSSVDQLKRTAYNAGEFLFIPVEAKLLAFDSVSMNPSAQSVNVAEGFRQFFEFEYPELVDKVAGTANSDLFLWFMAGNGSTLEARLRFAHALYINLDRKVDTSISPIARFDTPMLSLEGYIWLRNFERFDGPSQIEGAVNYELKNMRMEQIAWNAINIPDRVDPEALKEFNDLYAKAHEFNELLPDFAVMRNGPRRRHAGVIEDVDDFPQVVAED